jgi:hypothetical protein
LTQPRKTHEHHRHAGSGHHDASLIRVATHV